MNATLLVSLAALAAHSPAAAPRHAVPAVAQPAVEAQSCRVSPPRVVPVPYVTNREIVRRTAAGPSFGDDRTQSLSYGTAEVSVPPRHTRGCVESPRAVPVIGWDFPPHASRHVLLQRTQPYARGEFLGRMAGRVQTAAAPEILVFVHGFNVTFEDAARRAAQLVVDLQFGGVVVLFSWPSNGRMMSYLADQNAADASVRFLEQTLADLRRTQGARAVHVVAHSMGNRVVSAALTDLGTRNQRLVDEVVFTAPDVDRDWFLQRLPEMRKAAGRLTLYASATDMALQASRRAADYPRAGQAGKGLIVVNEMETVDATQISMDFLGHSYFVSARVLDDLLWIVRDGWPPDKRGLQAKSMGQSRYWRFIAR